MIRSITILAVALTGLLTLDTDAAWAQAVPFGKNKIQYRQFDWQVVSGDHVDVYFYPEAEQLARLTLAYAEESYAYLERKLEHHPPRRIPLIVYSSHQHFEQTNVFPGFIPEGVLGFTEYLKRRVALPFRGDYAQFLATLRHELVHFFQLSKIEETASLHPRNRSPSPQAIHWWTEGLAEFWSSEQDSMDEMYVRDLVFSGRLPQIRDFNHQYSFSAYPLGGEIHAYLTRRFGDEYIVRVYEEFWKYDTFEELLEGVLGVNLERLSREWHYDLQQRYFPLYSERTPLEVGSHLVIRRGGANFKPAIYSPPGDSVGQLVFMSPRTGYTNIYRTRLDEGEAGMTVILEGERSHEFESLHPWESRLHVNRDGVLAFVSKHGEADALVLWDIEANRQRGRYQWPDLIGLKSPAWDPTGTRVVFEGLSANGFSDLYVVDLTTHERSALTSDHYRDESPHWSPDGSEIVFASDRHDHGEFGSRNLFLLNVGDGSIRPLTYGPWIDQDPRWSHDGTRIAFASDRDGVFDLYAVDRSGNGRRLTAMAGAAFDPDWLPEDDGLVFAGFSEGGYRIYMFRFAADTADHPAIALDMPAGNRSGVASPVANVATSVSWQWQGVDAPVVASATPREYSSWSELSLDFAGGDAVVAPGAGSAQGAQFLVTDMLGDHVFFAGVSAVQGRNIGEFVDSFSGSLLYLNLSRRLNFGAGIFRQNGRFRDVSWDVYEEESYGGYFLASYPFSKFQRIELQLGFERSHRVDLDDGFTAGDVGPNTRPDPRDLTRRGWLATNAISLVRDNSLWLQSGPIDGHRFNLTAALATCFACTSPRPEGETALRRSATAEHFIVSGDYRRYFRTTEQSAYAVRLYAFFSDGAIPARSILGGPHRLRGYPNFSLAGSRVWLVNQEWRFPALHALSLQFPFGEMRFPGIQGAVFLDVGSSWLETQTRPEGTWGSYGGSLRFPLGIPLVLRLDFGRRFAIGNEPPVDFGGGEDFGDTFVDFFFGYNY